MLDVIDLTKSLCEIPSVTGDENAVMTFVSELLNGYGFSVERQNLPHSNRFNVYARKPGITPKILLTTHLDTVPPFFPPERSNDKEWLIGRGVCDAKGIAASMICAIVNSANPLLDGIAFLFVVGEETVSDGAKWAATQMKDRFDYLINGEPTDMKLVRSMKGAIVFELVSKGVAGHSAYPETGDSAIHRLIQDTSKIIDLAWPFSEKFGETNINIGKFQGGEAANVIAEKASVTGVLRLACSVEQATHRLSSVLDKRTSLNVLSSSEPRTLHTLSGEETCQVSFGCDIPHLEKLGTPLLFGPGSILDAHTDSEKIRVRDLVLASEKFASVCLKLLQNEV